MSFKSYFLAPRFHFNRIQFNLLTLCLITIGLVGGSYFTLNKIFKTKAINDTQHEWLFNLSTAADYTTDNVLVDNFGARPSESANLFTNSSFDNDNNGWEARAIPPTGWAVVPGSATFGTADFLVMKYEAKAFDTQTSAVVFDGGANSSGGWAGKKDQTRFQAISIPEGRPWVYITQTHGTNFDANDACLASTVGSTTAHLINNNEWMTIARNIEGLNTNWTNGIGSTLPRGNSNGSLSLNGFNQLTGVNRRTHELSNGEIIWDLAGNVWDWNSDTQTNEINTTTGYVDWNSPNVAEGARELYGPSSASYLSGHGVGRIYGGALNNGFLRGGYWTSSATAGVFALNLGVSPAYQINDVGFRCASDSVEILQSYQSDTIGRDSGPATLITNNSFVDAKLVQTVEVGSSANFDLSVFVYQETSGDEGKAVDSSVATVIANGVTYPSTQYTEVGNGWWKLSAVVRGSMEPADYGIAVRTGKSVKADDFYLTKSVNRFDNPSFNENIKGWLVGAVSGSATPTDWVVIPGNPAFDTSDFLVMKYEAKAYDTQESVVVADGGFSLGVSWAGDNNQTRYQAISSPDGRPWVRIAQNDGNFDALEACQAITIGSTNAHLISENEWMTIANNVADVSTNWTNGIGSTLPRGNSNQSASLDGSSPLAGINQRNLLTSNNEEIWDLAGNVWEWTSGTILRKDQPYAWNGSVGSTSWGYNDYEPGTNETYIKYYKIGSPLQQKNVEPLNFSYSHNADHGLGRIRHYSDISDTNTTNYGFLRGGHWTTGASAGVFALTLNNAPASRNNSFGFRCASDSVEISQSFQSVLGRYDSGGQKIISDSFVNTKIYQRLALGDTDTYIISAYVYDKTVGNIAGEVNSTVASLYADWQTLATEYTNVGDGWWKLTAPLEGSMSIKEYGLLVNADKTVVVDDFSLNRARVTSIYPSTAFSNNQVNSWDSLSINPTQASNSIVRFQLCPTDGATCETNIGTSNPTWQYWNGSAWEDTNGTNSEANSLDQLTQEVMQTYPTSSKKISVKVLMTYEGDSLPILNSLTLGLTTDITPPINATELVMHQENFGPNCTESDNCWTKMKGPTFSWLPGSDEENGSGLKGYCLYFGTDPIGDPAQSKGKLGISPVSISNTPCQFIVSSSSLDLGTSNFLASPLSMTDDFGTSFPYTYFLNLKAVDYAGNTSLSSLSIRFRYDETKPTNVTYISPASGNFSNVSDMSFFWPTDINGASIDNESGVLGWQYQINSTEGAWLGSTTSPELGLEYIPVGNSSYTLTSRDVIKTGNNVIYFRTVDKVGNFSDAGTIRTGNLSFGGDAPSFLPTDVVTITPDKSENNLFSISWPKAKAGDGYEVTKYYYMVRVLPPSTLETLQNNPATYIDNGNSTNVSAISLPNVNKGTNTVYVVAIDNGTTANYSPSNYISGTFTLNSNTPDNVGDLVASDSSIKSKSQWNVTLTWTEPVYQGAGNLIYQIYRSTDGNDFSLVGTSTGLSYVDNTPASTIYYYKVYTKDGALAVSSGTNAVSITPTGKWTSSPTLISGPEVSNISTRKATISWSTSRSSDSKIQFGTVSGKYGEVEPGNSNQLTSHSILLSGLNPETSYYYRAKWTDEDGNTGTSDEKSFSTQVTPSVKDVSSSGINLSFATIQFTSNGASGVKIYYGPSTNFGGLKTLDTSTSETIYTVNLTDLADGTKYYYKINTIDSDGYEYEGTVLDFTTLPRPRISNVDLQEVIGTAQTTLKVTWVTNTAISSIISYYPEGESLAVRDQVKVDLINGKHEMILNNLLPQTNYLIVVKGTDKIGNSATSEVFKYTTASDSRPPSISSVKVEGVTVPAVTTTGQESTAQLIVTWDTDEPATSQVEFGEGTGSSYSQKTQEDTNLTNNHLVLISNLTPSKVYHLRTISKDSAGNMANSVDTVTITPRATDNALDLVITSLSQIFNFLGGITK